MNNNLKNNLSNSNTSYSIGQYTGTGEDDQTLNIGTGGKIMFIIPYETSRSTGTYSSSSGTMGYGTCGIAGFYLTNGSSLSSTSYFPAGGAYASGSTISTSKPLSGYYEIRWYYSGGIFTFHIDSGHLWNGSANAYATNAGTNLLNYNSNVYSYIVFF